VDERAVTVVDDYLWTDLAEAGFRRRIWTYKADLDPAVQAELRTVQATLKHSEVVADFGNGELVVRRVVARP
jgi:hypothetical protein